MNLETLKNSKFEETTIVIKAEVCPRAKWSTQPEPIPVSSACSDNEYHCFPLEAMLVHCKQETAIQLLKIPQCT